MLFYFWNNVVGANDASIRQVGKSFLLINIGYTSTIIFFYFVPYLLFNFKKVTSEICAEKKIIAIYTIFFFLYLFLLNLFPNNYYGWDIYGNGWVSKLANITFNDENLKTIFIYSFFFISGLFLVHVSKNNLLLVIILLYFFLLSLFILPLFQEYFDPLIFLLILLFFYNKKDLNPEFIIFNYIFYIIFLIVCLFYYSQIKI
jgi:hypothetical protein